MNATSVAESAGPADSVLTTVGCVHRLGPKHSGTLTGMPGEVDPEVRAALLRRGRHLEAATVSWNVVGVVVLVVAAVEARSVALAGFGIDSLIEIGASTVVLRELAQ